MTFSPKAIFQRADKYDGVRPINIYLLRLLFFYSVLSILGLINPLKWLPIVMFEIVYKIIWLVIVAYPLWSTDQLAGSPAEEMTYAFAWVILPIVAMPWAYPFRTYVWPSKKNG